MASSSRHFITNATALVNSSLASAPLTNPSLRLDAQNKTVYRPRQPNEAPIVALVSGGGSGHEPSFAGFVGEGLLSASVAGSVFASPGAEQVSRALGRVAGEKGVVVIVMNYTGDVLNFGMAVEKAKAAGVLVDMVVVGDDVGVGKKKGGKVGRRGIAGTCLVLKIAGALAATGATVDVVSKTARLAAENIVSVGASLSHVHVPGRSTDDGGDSLKENEVELGMGIHNEAGSERLTDVDLPALVKKMLAQLLDTSDEDRAFLEVKKEDQTVLLVNNLGGVSPLELGGITSEVVGQLDTTFGIKPVRTLAGTFMTSLNGLGFSISLLRIQDTGLGHGKSMIELLDAPSEATGWPVSIKAKTWEIKKTAESTSDISQPEPKPSNFKIKHARAVSTLTVALDRLIKAEPDITNYDTVVGDGDCGIGLERGAEAILRMLEKAKTTDDVAIFLDRVIQVVESTMDGTSGALFAIFLNALAHNIRALSPSQPEDITVGTWAKALEHSLTALSKYTPAKVGDRTIIDALEPFITKLSRNGIVDEAAEAAAAGAQKTRTMQASLGRSVYVGGDRWQVVPDPGAYGLSEFLLGLAQGPRC